MHIKGCLDRYSTHGPKKEWIVEYFRYKNDFLEKHSLGSGMIIRFKIFLKDSRLSDEKYNFSRTAEIVEKLGLRNSISWAILFVNLAFTPQINWFVKNVQFDKNYSRDEINKKLLGSGAKNQRAIGNIWFSFGRFMALPFGEVGIGYMEKDNGRSFSITRTPWLIPDPRVILYAIFKYSESCNSKGFNFAGLIDPNENEGANVGEIFGIDRDSFKKMLLEMSTDYPDFINASFAGDFSLIVLSEDKGSEDVLELF